MNKKLFCLPLVSVFALVACGKEPVLEDAEHMWVIHGDNAFAETVDGDVVANGWNGKSADLYEASAMEAVSMKDVKDASEDIFAAIGSKAVKYAYMKEHVAFGLNEAGWTVNAMRGGNKVTCDGTFAFKVSKITTSEDELVGKSYAEDVWMPSPEAGAVESLTPSVLFMPPHSQTADENGFDHNSNPVVIGGAGIYTVIAVEYANPTDFQYGIGLVKVAASGEEGAPYSAAAAVAPTPAGWVPTDHTYGVIGGFNDWAADVAMTTTDNKVWTATVTLTADTELKVRADGAWTDSWGLGGYNGGNFAVAAGTHTVSIDFTNNPTVIVSVE